MGHEHIDAFEYGFLPVSNKRPISLSICYGIKITRRMREERAHKGILELVRERGDTRPACEVGSIGMIVGFQVYIEVPGEAYAVTQNFRQDFQLLNYIVIGCSKTSSQVFLSFFSIKANSAWL